MKMTKVMNRDIFHIIFFEIIFGITLPGDLTIPREHHIKARFKP